MADAWSSISTSCLYLSRPWSLGTPVTLIFSELLVFQHNKELQAGLDEAVGKGHWVLEKGMKEGMKGARLFLADLGDTDAHFRANQDEGSWKWLQRNCSDHRWPKVWDKTTGSGEETRGGSLVWKQSSGNKRLQSRVDVGNHGGQPCF